MAKCSLMKTEEGMTDDHLFINRLARIKTIDIIASDPEGGFTPTWHTINDNMEHIRQEYTEGGRADCIGSNLQ